MNILEVNGLGKKFDDFTAVNGISFNVGQGEIFGFLGPNGAGKSTTIKMLTTILNPSFGEARVKGYDIARQRDEVRENLGIVFQDPSSDTFLTGRDNLHYHGVVYHMSKKKREERIAEVLELLDLEGKENIPLKDCSGGVQRRFEVARGFMTHPGLLFLDEPTIGLDIQARKTLWNYITKLRDNENVTILLTTHYIEEADYLCDRVSIIDHGNVAAIDSPGNLKDVVGTDIIRVELANGRGEVFNEVFNQVDWVKDITSDSTGYRLNVEGGDKRTGEVLMIAGSRGIAISSIELLKPNLEDAFLYYTGKTIREDEGNFQEIRKAVRRKRK